MSSFFLTCCARKSWKRARSASDACYAFVSQVEFTHQVESIRRSLVVKLTDVPAQFTLERCSRLQKADAFVVSLYLFDAGDRFSCPFHVDDETVRKMAVIAVQIGANVVLAVSRCWDLARKCVNFLRSSKEAAASRPTSAEPALACFQHEEGATAVLVIEAPHDCVQ